MSDVRESVFADIRAERDRQIIKEGWTEEHDDEHSDGEMAVAAAMYAIADSNCNPDAFRDVLQLLWPWDEKWWKPKDPEHNLIVAGALIAAELERRRRAKKKEQA